MKDKANKILSILLPILTVACIIIIWSVAASVVDSEFVLPNLKDTVFALGSLLFGANSKTFYTAFFMTILRTVIAFVCSFILAFLLAYLSKKRPLSLKVISPLISITRALPTIAVVLLLLLWTNSFVAPIIVTMLVVLPTLYTNLYNSLCSVDDKLTDMCAFFGVDKKKVFKKVSLPIIMPSMLISVGSGFALNLKLMVAAEVLAATANSIGYQLTYNNYNLEIATMIALVLIIVIVAVLVELIFSLLSKKVGKWK